MKDDIINDDSNWNIRSEDINILELAMNAFTDDDDDESSASADEEPANPEPSTSDAEALPPEEKSSEDCMLDFVIKMYLHTLHSRELVTEIRNNNKVLPLKHLAVLTLLYSNMKYSERLLLEFLRNEVGVTE